MKDFAIIENGVVVNIAQYDGESSWSQQPGQIVVDLTSVNGVVIGSTYLNGKFIPPAAIQEKEIASPFNLSYWDVNPPESNEEAIDRLAAVLSANGKQPIPQGT